MLKQFFTNTQHQEYNAVVISWHTPFHLTDWNLKYFFLSITPWIQPQNVKCHDRGYLKRTKHINLLNRSTHCLWVSSPLQGCTVKLLYTHTGVAKAEPRVQVPPPHSFHGANTFRNQSNITHTDKGTVGIPRLSNPAQTLVSFPQFPH